MWQRLWPPGSGGDDGAPGPRAPVRARPRPGPAVALAVSLAAGIAVLGAGAFSGGPAQAGAVATHTGAGGARGTTGAGGTAGTTSMSTSTSTSTSTTAGGTSGATPLPTSTTVPSGNLVGSDGPTATGSTGTWSSQFATLSWTSQPAPTSAGSLALVATGTHAMLAVSGSPSAGGLVPVRSGSVLTGTVAVRAQGATEAEPVILLYDPQGDLATMLWGPLTAAGPEGWAVTTAVVGQVPPSASAAALGVIVSSTTTGFAAYVAEPSLTAVGDPGAAAVVGPLRTSGTDVLDAAGHGVTLRAVELDGLEWSSARPGVNQAAVDEAKAWGADAVRVPLGSQLWLSGSCDYDPGYAAAVDQVVHWITGAGMVAVLDLDFNLVGPGCPAPSGQVMADAPGALTFWGQVAARYASNPLVAFDLYNEPHDISDAVWLSGGQVTDPSSGVTFQAAGMQQLYDAVRRTGAQNLVLVTGGTWGNRPPAALVAGTNIVYAAHAYSCPSAPPPDPSCTADPTDPGALLDPWATFQGANGVPVMLAEFGWPSQGDGTYTAAAIAYAESRHWSWNVFAWGTDAPWGLVASTTGTTAEPTPSGMPVLAALAAAAR